MKVLLVICSFILSSSTCNASDVFNLINFLKLHPDPDTYRNVSLLISSKGYPVEDHIVETEDGFLLSMQRIPHGRNEYYMDQQSKQVVFLQHGLLSSAADYVMNFPHQSLGFILADAGFDVWLGNIRGNTYSRHHVNYTPSMKEFWEFSFDEMATYDMPAMIDYALNVTKQKQLFYIAHSQGTTIGFALLSECPEYNKKVKLFIAMAPVATVGYITSPIRLLAPFASDFNFLFKILGVREFLPSNIVMKYFAEHVCDTKLKFICEQVIFVICGTDHAQLNETRLGVYVSHSPAGASTQSIIHYAQMVNSKKFMKYDFGESGNKAHYNKTIPPEYHVENITTPVSIFWSKNDRLADFNDVHLLQKKLKTLVSSHRVNFTLFNHLDFVWGINAGTLVYDDILTLLKKYS